jgi:carbonic anhydrase
MPKPNQEEARQMRAMYDKVFENNRKWVEEMSAKDADFFSNLAKEQNPDFLFIGCSDSRVPANVIMGVDPGSVFVHRNIANLVLHTDLNVQSVIEYAVTYLKVKHIVVCGHYGCGGVKAAMESKDLGVLNPWLREIRDVYRAHYDSLETMEESVRYNHLVEMNVREGCINVIKTAAVQHSWVQNQFPIVHGWVYDLKNGELKDLKLDFNDAVERIRKVYRLDD